MKRIGVIVLKIKNVKVVAILLLMVILITGCSQKAKVDDGVAAVVNGTAISMEDFNKNFALYKMDYEMQFGSEIFNENTDYGLNLVKTVKEQVLEKLITDQILLQLALEKNIKVEDTVIEESYQEYLQFLNNNETYKAFSVENGIDEAFVKNLINTGEIINLYQAQFIEELAVDEAAARKYYDENPDFFFNEEVRARHILVEDRELADTLYTRAMSGESFEALAQEFSIDPGSKDLGGDLGYFPQGVMIKAFEDAAFALEIGEISEPVATNYGYHIIKLEDKVSEVFNFDEIVLDIIDFLKSTELQKFIDSKLDAANIERNIK